MEKLRHPWRALDLKAKDLIGHLWVSLIIDQCNKNAWFVSSFCTVLTLFCTVLKKTALLLTNQHGEIFSCILLVMSWRKKMQIICKSTSTDIKSYRYQLYLSNVCVLMKCWPCNLLQGRIPHQPILVQQRCIHHAWPHLFSLNTSEKHSSKICLDSTPFSTAMVWSTVKIRVINIDSATQWLLILIQLPQWFSYTADTLVLTNGILANLDFFLCIG